MASLPRVITVDPTWSVSRLVRAAIELLEGSIIQVDVPGSMEALEEVSRGGYHVLVTSLQIDRQMKGFELALRVRQSSPDTAVVILADEDDQEIDEETRTSSPFIYLRRPVDVAQFVRVLTAALKGEDVFEAFMTPEAAAAPEAPDLGLVPALDLKVGAVVIEKLLTDVGAMAIVLSSRAGEVLLERGAVGYIDRERLTHALLPSVRTMIAMGDLVGGHPAVLQFFDGEEYDVFVLSIGFHHFLSLVFDGQMGNRQFGAVTRFGRRAAEDLKALLGASAFLIQPSVPATEAPRRKTTRAAEPEPEPEEVAPIALKAETWDETPAEPEPEAMQLEPISNFDPSIFDALGQLDSADADDFFNPEKLAEIANESRRGRGPISYDEARELGIVP
jgi:DNA-binding NarL/FixJ family response regulator